MSEQKAWSESRNTDLRGRIAMRMAFSWTCHPNMNDPRAQRRRQRRKPRAPRGRHQRDTKAGFRIAQVTQTFRQKEKQSLPNSERSLKNFSCLNTQRSSVRKKLYSDIGNWQFVHLHQWAIRSSCDSPGWTAQCTQVWQKERWRAGWCAEIPEPSLLSWRHEEGLPHAAASASHLKRCMRTISTALQ